MLLYTCFSFSEVMYQMFLTVRGAVGYARCSLCLCSCRLMTRMGDLEMFPRHHHHQNLVFFFFGVNLDFLDFSGGIFDL